MSSIVPLRQVFLQVKTLSAYIEIVIMMQGHHPRSANFIIGLIRDYIKRGLNWGDLRKKTIREDLSKHVKDSFHISNVLFGPPVSRISRH